MTTMATTLERRQRPTERTRPQLDFERKPFYSPAEIARVLGISTQTVLDRIHDGSLHAVRISARIYRIPLASFMQLLGGPPRIRRRPWPAADADRSWARLDKEERTGSR